MTTSGHLSVDILQSKKGSRKASLSTLPTLRATDREGSSKVDLLLPSLLADHLVGQEDKDGQKGGQGSLSLHGKDQTCLALAALGHC